MTVTFTEKEIREAAEKVIDKGFSDVKSVVTMFTNQVITVLADAKVIQKDGENSDGKKT